MQKILMLLCECLICQTTVTTTVTSESLWNYHRDKINDDENDNDDNDNNINNNKTTRSNSFKYKTKIIGSTPDNASRLNAEVVVPLKYQCKFRRSLDFSLSICEI